MLETSARLLRLLSLLQARPTWSGAELIDRLEVTDRTLRRDIDRLRALGYPVHSTSGPAGGYMLGPGAALPPLMLDDDEGLAVALGLESAAAGSIPELGEASQRALAKLEQVMPPRLRRRLAGVRSTILRVPDRGPRVPLAHLDELAAACAAHRTARFRYRDYSGATSERSVEPHRLVLMGHRWYLVAWDTERADWRTFRVDRIEPPVANGTPFTPRAEPDGDMAGYVIRAVTSAPYRYRARVILHAPIEAMRERLRPSYGVLEAVSARRCRLITGAPCLDSLAMYVAMIGVPFRVESPPELRDHLRAMSERLAGAARG